MQSERFLIALVVGLLSVRTCLEFLPAEAANKKAPSAPHYFPLSFDKRIRAVQLLCLQNKMEPALTEIRKMERKTRSSILVLTLELMCLAALSRHTEVEQLTPNALKKATLPANKEHLLFMRSCTRERAGNLKGALDDMTRILEISPKYPMYLGMHAGYLSRLGRWQQGLADMRVAGEVQDFSERWYVDLANFYWVAKQFDKVLPAVDEGLKKFPKSPVLYSFRGSFEQIHRKDKKAALRDLSHAIEFGSDDIHTYLLRSDIAQDMLIPDLALSDLNKAAALAPSDPDVFRRRAVVYEFLLLRPDLAEKDRSTEAMLLGKKPVPARK
jgi:tetratricopeptide (TPR) repeat protein